MLRAQPSDRTRERKARIVGCFDGKEKDYGKRSARTIQKQIFQEIKKLEEVLSEEEMELLGLKHSLERMNEARRYAKMEDEIEKLVVKGEITFSAGRGSQTSGMEGELVG